MSTRTLVCNHVKPFISCPYHTIVKSLTVSPTALSRPSTLSITEMWGGSLPMACWNTGQHVLACHVLLPVGAAIQGVPGLTGSAGPCESVPTRAHVYEAAGQDTGGGASAHARSSQQERESRSCSSLSWVPAEAALNPLRFAAFLS